MTDLDELLQAASKSSPGTRIQYRDPIAAHGSGAIGPMVDWIPSPKLGAFAVRVLTKIGQDAAHKGQVVAALRDCDRRGLDPNVARDVDDAIRTLRPFHAAKRGGSVPAAATWAGRATRTTTRGQCRRAFPQRHARYLLVGGTSDWLLGELLPARSAQQGWIGRGEGPSAGWQATREGFERLKAEHRLDLSMEALGAPSRSSSASSHRTRSRWQAQGSPPLAINPQRPDRVGARPHRP